MRASVAAAIFICAGALASTTAPAQAASPSIPSAGLVRIAPVDPAPHACLFQNMLVRTAYRPNAPESSDKAGMGCASGAARIGAGYTRLLSTSALRHPHLRVRA